MSANDRSGIGIVGCGIISEVQAESIQQTKNARLVSVYSRNLENAARVGNKFGVPWSTDWDAFINDNEIDVISVCTPSGNHLDYGKLAAEAGKHVVVEKPIEVTVERGRQLIEACRDQGVKLAVIYQNRFVPDVQRLKQRIGNGELGEIFLASAYIKWYRKQAYYDSAEWRGTLALDGGGVLINQAIHTIDLLQWMAGEVESVCGKVGTLTHESIEGEDNAVASIQYKNGALGVIEGSTSVQPPQPRRLEIHGSKGMATLTGNQQLISYASESNQDLKELPQQEPRTAHKGYSLKPHQHQFEAIINAIQADQEPPVSGEDSLKSLAIIQGIYESSKSKQWVNLDSLTTRG